MSLISMLPARYAKGIISILGGAVTVLSYYYGGDKWFGAVIAALASIGVIGAPNSTAPTAPPAVQPARKAIKLAQPSVPPG
jgi:VIT1/CCC1 family predicted Fe2+/Mn2+ transporter